MLVGLGPGGCASAQGGVPGELARAAQSAASATATGALAVDLLAARRTSAAAADTTLADALGDVQEAEVAVASVTVATRADDAARRRTLAVVHRATTALVDARTWASTPDVVRVAPTARLEVLTAELDALAASLGGAS